MGGSTRPTEAEDKSRWRPWLEPLGREDPDEHREPLAQHSLEPSQGSAFTGGTSPPAVPVSHLSTSVKRFYKGTGRDQGRLGYTWPPRKLFRWVPQKDLAVPGCSGLPSCGNRHIPSCGAAKAPRSSTTKAAGDRAPWPPGTSSLSLFLRHSWSPGQLLHKTHHYIPEQS